MTLPRGAVRRAGFLAALAALVAGAGFALMPSQPTATASASSPGPPASSPKWAETWSASPAQATPKVANRAYGGFRDETVRDIIFTSIGGWEIRVRLSNVFGTRPLTVGQASVAVVSSGGNVSGPARPVRFNGSSSVRVPSGGEVVSDPVRLAVLPLEDIAVSIYLPEATGPATYHFAAQQVNYLAAGNHVNDTAGAAFGAQTTSWYFLDGMDVLGASKRAGVVVAFGDSITDGAGSAVGANDRWPDFLARRLDARYGDGAPGVLDEGIGGNRVLTGSACYGQSGLARFGRDVLSRPDVRDVILLEGINDISFSQDPDTGCPAPNTDVSAAQIIDGYKTLIAQAHARGLKIFGGTLTPYKGSFVWSPGGQAKWDTVNRWIRTSGAFDGVIDFARVLQDPGDPDYLSPAYSSGDGLHPNDAGYAAMANAINLALLK
jgi:lysophospholipase L1-like esterase